MKTIMTVDDSASIRQIINFTLKQVGYKVVEAVNGRDALEKLETEPVHMLITDVNMPELDGISLVRKLREHKSYKFMPIIILTTEFEPEKKRTAKEAGATGWIVKPFNPEQLVAVVRKVMGL